MINYTSEELQKSTVLPVTYCPWQYCRQHHSLESEGLHFPALSGYFLHHYLFWYACTQPMYILYTELMNFHMGHLGLYLIMSEVPSNAYVHTNCTSVCSGIRGCSIWRGQVYDTHIPFTLSLCLCLFQPVLPAAFPSICLIFCAFLWSSLFTLADECQASQYYIHIHILHIYVNITHLRTYYEQILKYFNCVKLILNTIFTFNTYTYTWPWQWDVRYNTCCTHTYLH